MSDFWDSLPEQPSEAREEMILDAIQSGDYDPITWVPVGVGLDEGVELLLSVASDALKIDGERVNVNMTTMQKIVDLLGYAFPTSKISDLIYEHAAVRIGACTQTPDSKMAYTERTLKHSAAVDAKIAGRTGLASTVGKDWVLTNRLVGHADKSANYGWHDPGAQYTSPGGIKLWQPLGLAHDRWHVDYCLAPNTKVLTADLGWVPVSRLTVGTELIGFDEKLGGHRMRGSYVTSTNQLVLDCYEVVTDRGTIIASEEHRFVVANKRSGVKWVKTKKLRTDQTISFLCDPWDRAPDSWESGWLAGILDGEGWVGSNHMVGFAQKPGLVLDLACSILERDGFKLYKKDNGHGCIQVIVLGERAGMRALGRYRPLRLLEKSRSLWEGRRPTGGQGTRAARILEVNYIGKHPVVALGTTTKTLIAEGFLSHNSQVVRLISRNCLVDGEQFDLMQLLTTDELAHLLSYEGRLQLVRMPGVPVYTPATPAPPVAGDSLGERCIAWCLKHVGHKEQPPGSNDSPLIRQWLAPCARGYGDKRVVLGISKMNWCAAFQCSAMQACLRPGEAKPHDYRAGVVELVEDTYPGQDGKMPFAGRYIPIEQTRKGDFTPSVGDLAIWDRSVSGKPETSWWRHVNRVISYSDSEGTFQTVGGNENQQVSVAEHHIGAAKLLGWIHYPQPDKPQPQSGFSEQEKDQIMNMVGMFLREAADRIWRGVT